MNSHGDLLTIQRDFFHSHKTRDYAFRMNQLTKLKQVIKSHEKDLSETLKQDLNKSEFESYITEIGIILEEINYVLKNLKKWIKPQKVKTPLTHIGAKSLIYSEPYGVSLIISPWNYPLNLAIAPLVGAIAAGNCVVLKPSELTPHTSGLLTKLINTTFPQEYIHVVEGGVDTSTALLEEKFDHIFFTGSVPVGKIVMAAAAKHLTPVTLELGGKSPCFVHKDADLKLAAKRIVWGKFLNAGQTCVAPDYLFVHEDIKQELLIEMNMQIKNLYGDNALNNPDYTHIVNEKHFGRLVKFLDSGNKIIGGKKDSENLVIEPTILDSISWNDPIMKDEIFGPILPVLEYETLSVAIEEVRKLPKPLALYVFSQSKQVQNNVIHEIPFGGGCINDTIFHLSTPYLPFGGVGESGTGSYHGRGSFDAFSHQKSILTQTTMFDIPIRYPNTKNALKYIRKLLK